MSSSHKASLRVLERRLADVRATLEKAEPHALKEYEHLRELIDERRSTESIGRPRYVSRQRAIEAVLTEKGTWMTKAAIADRLQRDGYVTSKAELGVLNTTINYHAKPDVNHFQKLGDGTGWDVLVGLPGWPPPADDY